MQCAGSTGTGVQREGHLAIRSLLQEVPLHQSADRRGRREEAGRVSEELGPHPRAPGRTAGRDPELGGLLQAVSEVQSGVA